MTIPVQTMQYYDWEDIEQFLCDAMGFDVKYFRDYRSVVPGKYKDFWHVWISINYDQVNNDSYATCFFDMMLDALDDPDILKEYGDWILVLKPALEKLQKELGTDEFNVRYCW